MLYFPFTDQLRFVSHLYDNDAHSPKDIKDTAKVYPNVSQN